MYKCRKCGWQGSTHEAKGFTERELQKLGELRTQVEYKIISYKNRYGELVRKRIPTYTYLFCPICGERLKKVNHEKIHTINNKENQRITKKKRKKRQILFWKNKDNNSY